MIKMAPDFDFYQTMRMSNIKRWGIIEMAREQSLAEHSYNVTMIAMAIAEKMSSEDMAHGGVDVNFKALMGYALCHDMPELVTGDIPTLAKQKVKEQIDELERDLFPATVKNYDWIKNELPIEYSCVKVADYVDGIQFAMKFCIDSRKESVIDHMKSELSKFIDTVPDGGEVKQALEEVWPDAKILSKSLC